ncbi:aminoglycoside phosphotransferase [Rhodococcus triatomae BKS 15-14]|nr:aminoglycoside phosphotransferase [Rhodococcus triatomae BKS 15-14]
MTGPLSLRRLGDGRSNLTFAVSDRTGRRWVARRPPLGKLLASAHDVVREGRILSALASTEVPVPAVLGVCEDARVASAPVLVMTMIEGLPAHVHSDLEPTLGDRLGRSIAEGLAGIHRVDIASAGLGTLSSQAPYAHRQIRRWSRQWEESKLREVPALDRMTKWLNENTPLNGETRLLHGDYHLGNLLVDPRSGELRAILDWELSTLGDPLADVGTMLGYWPESDSLRTADPSSRESGALGLPDRRRMAELYAESSGRNLDDVKFWYVLGLWKIAIIIEGVRRRAREVPSSFNDSPVPTQDFVDKSIDRAWTAVASGI